MNSGGKSDAGVEICRGEDAIGDFVATRLEGALDGESAADRDGIGHTRESFGVEDVFDVTEVAVGACGDMTWEKVGEGEGVAALFVFYRFCEEFPFK